MIEEGRLCRIGGWRALTGIGLISCVCLSGCSNAAEQVPSKQSASVESSGSQRQADRALAALVERNPRYVQTMTLVSGKVALPAPAGAKAAAASADPQPLSSWELQALSSTLRDIRKTVKTERQGSEKYLVLQLDGGDWTMQVESQWRRTLEALQTREASIREEAMRTLPSSDQKALLQELDNGPVQRRKELEAALATLRAEGSSCRLKLRSDSELPAQLELRNVLSYKNGNKPAQEVQSIIYTIY